jgi:nucleoside-triphosphatase
MRAVSRRAMAPSRVISRHQRGRRRGFSLEPLGGERGVLAHIELPGTPRVGRYGVDLGKMELASRRFREAVSALLERPVPVVATMQSPSHPFTDTLKRRSGIETLRLTRANRDDLPKAVADRLRSAR